jgi:hypothetical protein
MGSWSRLAMHTMYSKYKSRTISVGGDYISIMFRVHEEVGSYKFEEFYLC